MNEIIIIQKFEVIDKGDISVGINSATYELLGPFYFQTIQDLETFEQDLRRLFENITDCKLLILKY